MNTYFVWLYGFFLLFIAGIGMADDKVAATGNGSVALDKTFLGQLNDRGMDWSPWTSLAAIEDSQDTPTAGKTFASPNKRFSVQTAVADREFDVVINDAQTGLVSRLPFDYCPIFSLEWSPDSKTILTVGHLSMTSLIVLFHWDGQHWLQFAIEAPESEGNNKFHVVKWEFKSGYIKATYIVNHRTENGRSLDLYRCTFSIDPTNGGISEVTKTPINLKDFVLLRNSRN